MKISSKKIVALIMIFALAGAMTPLFHSSADTSWARVTLSDSAPEATGVTYSVEFLFQETANSVVLTFPSEFGDRGGVIAGDPAECSVVGLVATCTDTYTGGLTHTLSFTDMTNPGKDEAEGVADTYVIDIAGDGEWANAMFAIIEPVTVTARVSALLSFVVSGVDSDEEIHGTALNVTTTPTSINFGTLEIDTPVRAAQDLSVTTNASDGYSVTVFQDQRLTSPGGDTIKNFEEDGSVPTSAAKGWTSPSENLSDPNTWGHFGFTSEDTQVAASCLGTPGGGGHYFDGNVWAGFSGSTPAEIMCHVGPSDGSTQHIGTTRVGYQIEISALQPAGEYSNVLTYIATPTF